MRRRQACLDRRRAVLVRDSGSFTSNFSNVILRQERRWNHDMRVFDNDALLWASAGILHSAGGVHDGLYMAARLIPASLASSDA